MSAYDPEDPEQQEMLGRLAAGAHAAGNASVAANPGDPAFWMLLDGVTSKKEVHRDGCYICDDPEFAQMGLPLCKPCPQCVGLERGTGHVPADDEECDDCGYNLREAWEREQHEAQVKADPFRKMLEDGARAFGVADEIIPILGDREASDRWLRENGMGGL